MQIVVDVDKFDENTIKDITTGACINVEGTLVKSQGAEQSVEIQASSIEVYGTAGSDYPLQKKGHSMEFLREHANLRMRSNTFGAVFRIRHNMAMAIHTYFHEHGFFYWNSPTRWRETQGKALRTRRLTKVVLYIFRMRETTTTNLSGGIFLTVWILLLRNFNRRISNTAWM